MSHPKKQSSLVFLDRDGTLNFDPGYLSDPEKFELFEGAAEALGSLSKLGFKIILVSNQSGLARGLIEVEDLIRIHAKLQNLLQPYGARIELFQICTHLPDDGCGCRKPSPMLLEEAAVRFGGKLSGCFMVGDKASDVRAGRAAGCKTALVRTGYGRETEGMITRGEVDFIGDSVVDVCEWIIQEAK